MKCRVIYLLLSVLHNNPSMTHREKTNAITMDQSWDSSIISVWHLSVIFMTSTSGLNPKLCGRYLILETFLVGLKTVSLSEEIQFSDDTLSEETAQPTVYHHLSQVSVDMQLCGLIKCREDSDFSSTELGITWVSCIKTVNSGDILLKEMECQLSPLS